jgi:lipid-binding SYLF domain-containing protein/predicted outer membrane protein
MNHSSSAVAMAVAMTAAAFAPPPVQGQAASRPQGQTPTQTTPVPMPTPATSDTMLTQAGRSFVQRAASTGQAEVAAARLALERSRDAQVRQFAQRMLDDHAGNNTLLRSLAGRHRVDLPDQPQGEDATMLQDLRSAQGTETFDQRYIALFGVQAHQKAVTLFEHYALNVAESALRDYASRSLPTLREHLAMARQVGAAIQARGPAAPAGGQDRAEADRELQNARETVIEAAQVVQQIKNDADAASLLQQAKAVLLLPDYARGGLVVGAQGGQGVLVARQRDGWSDPVFYNLAGLSVGAQAGAAGGRIALLLMTDRALERVRSERRFSLTADAGLTVLDLSAEQQASGGKLSDVAVWSDTQGAYAGASVGLSGMMVDREANDAYYHRASVQPAEILDGRVENPNPNLLEQALNV